MMWDFFLDNNVTPRATTRSGCLAPVPSARTENAARRAPNGLACGGGYEVAAKRPASPFFSPTLQPPANPAAKAARSQLTGPSAHLPALPAADPSWANDWFRHAIIYQVRVDSFADGRACGHGDLQGITEHLEHIQSLSDCLWLSPVCRSPMCDGGYDVADYTQVDPRFGTDAALNDLIDRCHAHGMRVIVELVANHTSTQHPWFAHEGLYRKTFLQLQALQLPAASGRALLAGGPAHTPVELQAKALVDALGNGPHARAAMEAGYYAMPDQLARLAHLLYGDADERAASCAGDFYLWTQEPDQHYREAFLAFPDDYESIWELDGASGSYYYHSFFAHQADLNYRSPRMRATMESVIRHWARRGVDGLRIDAAPFFWKEEGTPCMNLPGMHALFRDWRAMLQREFPQVALLAEAVQPPEQLSSYFGHNDECHMMFNAPLAEALFHALARESAAPLQQVVTNLSKIPAQAQLATFLRNHDEFYTAWLDPADEQAVWERFAPAPEHRVHHGIRRRLASMVGNPQALRLLTGLLYLFPGSPTLYYGDEIGMGDRFTEVKPGPVQDRDAMRTPMQWTDGPTGGFTRGQPEVQPILTGPYATAEVNVAAQEAEPESLLNWHRRLAALRRRTPLWALGSLEVRDSGNPQVLCFTRTYQAEQCLVTANLSGQAQQVRPYDARTPRTLPAYCLQVDKLA